MLQNVVDEFWEIFAEIITFLFVTETIFDKTLRFFNGRHVYKKLILFYLFNNKKSELTLSSSWIDSTDIPVIITPFRCKF